MSSYLITCFFLVFAGMLIGYVLFYRDQSEEENLRVSLSRENDDLRTSLKLAHNSHEKLSDRFTRQQGQLNVLQQLCDDWSTSREEAERDRATLETEVAERTRRLEEVSGELHEEKQKRNELEDQRHNLIQEQLSQMADVESDWRSKFARVENSWNASQSDVEILNSDKDRLAQQLHDAEGRIGELESELKTQKSLLDTATKNHSGLSQEYVSVETSLEHISEQLNEARAECATALSGKKVAEETVADLEKSRYELQSEVETLQAKVAEIGAMKSQVESLQGGLLNSTERLASVTAQRDHALDGKQSIAAQAKGLQQRIENQELTIHRLREKHEQTIEHAKAELERRVKLEAALETQKYQLDEFEQKYTEQTSALEQRQGNLTNELEQTRSRMADQIANQTEALKKLVGERDEVKVELEMLRREHTDLGQQNQTKSLTIGELNALVNSLRSGETYKASELEKMQAQYQEANARRENLQSELEEARFHARDLTEKIEELKTTSLRISELEQLVRAREDEESNVTHELRTLRGQYATAYQRQQDLQEELDRVRLEQKTNPAPDRQASTESGLLKMKLKASEETIRKLRKERTGVLARLANYRTVTEPEATVISFKQAMEIRDQAATSYDSEYGGTVSRHDKRGMIYTEAPDSQDDLKRISGIAVVLEARLNDYGIYTFRQIMEWEPEAVEEFSRLLAFRDRIVRDDWIGQARFFYNEKQSIRIARNAA